MVCRQQQRQEDVEADPPTVETWLKSHPWPGNVRELENLVERAAVLARGDIITRDDLLLEPAAAAPASAEPDDMLPLQAHLDRAAARRIRLALARAQGRRNDAASELGVERTTLYRLIKKFGLDDA